MAADTAAANASDKFLRVNSGEKGHGLDDMVMDLVDDERDGLRKRQSVLKWDQKKRKYVREATGGQGDKGSTSMDGLKDRGKKRLRDESGNL